MIKTIMDKMCVKCKRKIKMVKNEQNIKNKKFKCDACKTDTIPKSKYCCSCGFTLMEDEKDKCKVCKLKEEIN